MEPVRPARTLLVMAHPGHELRILGWIARLRPVVLCLTDGSGSQGTSRVARTRDVLEHCGAAWSELNAPLPDQCCYQKLLDHDLSPFDSFLGNIRVALASGSFEWVLSDATEGFNPMHDICHDLTALAVAGQPVVQPCHLDFLLEGPAEQCPDSLRQGQHRLRLTPQEQAWKRGILRETPQLQAEAERLLAQHPGCLGMEVLRPAQASILESDAWEARPYYERFGEGRVAEGTYPRVIRRKEHLMALMESLCSAQEGRPR